MLEVWWASQEEGLSQSVATPLLEECEDDTHTLEMGTWESSGTPKTSKLDCRSQTSCLEAFFMSLKIY